MSDIQPGKAELRYVALDALQAHPNNPRLVMREDVVTSIAGQIKEHGFSVAHGILARAVNGGYEVISGHHRKEAAARAGLQEIPCFIEEMTDERANMMLVLCNAQGELSPLERGMHVLMTVPASDGGRGKKGGLAEYSRDVGEERTSLLRLRDAAEVYLCAEKVCNNAHVSLTHLLDKAAHLTAIHEAPQEAWPNLAAKLSDDAYTIAKVKEDAKFLKELKAAIPSWWKADFAAISALAMRTPQEPARLKKMYSEAAQAHADLAGVELLYTHKETDETIEKDGRDYRKYVAEPYEYDAQADFKRILFENTTIRVDEVRGALKRVRAHIAAHSSSTDKLSPVLTDAEWTELRIRQEQEEKDHARQVERDRVLCGDCLSALQFWHGGTIHLLVTDPPYGMDFQSNRRIVKEKANKIAGDEELVTAAELLSSMLRAAHPHMAEDSHLLVWIGHEGIPAFRAAIENAGFSYKMLVPVVKPNHTTGDLFGTFANRCEYVIHAVKGSPNCSHIDALLMPKKWAGDTGHPTEKPVEALEDLIGATSSEGDLVVDPFCGTGSSLVAAQKLKRRYWGAEISEEYAEMARDRLAKGAGL